MMNELKPCKCGEMPHRINNYSNGTRKVSYMCMECFKESKASHLENEAIRLWSRRANDEQR